MPHCHKQQLCSMLGQWYRESIFQRLKMSQPRQAQTIAAYCQPLHNDPRVSTIHGCRDVLQGLTTHHKCGTMSCKNPEPHITHVKLMACMSR